MARIKITHAPSGDIIAFGKLGWEIFSFEGNFYISSKCLKTKGFKFSGIPGICTYKFLYFWYHFQSKDGKKSKMMGWKYWLPNPLFPFIAFRIGIPNNHPELIYEESQ